MHATDEELVAQAAAGNAGAFDQLVGRWERQIYFLAYRMLGREEDARDVTQEAFLRAFRGLKGFKGQSKFSSWLYRIALNLCRDWLRREQRGSTMQPSAGFELNEPAIVDDPDPFGEGIGFVHVLGGQEDRDVGVLVHRLDLLPHLGPAPHLL